MITTPEKYQDQLWTIQNENPPSLVHLPFAKKIYKVDNTTRTIEAPKSLSVSKDHKAENIYFCVDRFFDYVDLSKMTCIIQYQTSDGSTGIYPVPYYDIQSYKDEDKMLVPWLVNGNATMCKGKITFTIRFYKLDQENTKFIYNLNYLPATSTVLDGMDVQADDLSGKYDIGPTAYDELVDLVSRLSRQDVYWLEIK